MLSPGWEGSLLSPVSFPLPSSYCFIGTVIGSLVRLSMTEA